MRRPSSLSHVFATLQNSHPWLAKPPAQGAEPKGRWEHADPAALPCSAGIWLLTDQVCIKDVPAGTIARDDALFMKAALQQEG